MFSPSKRLNGIAEYYFAGKLREIAQMQRDGKPVINLGIGSPDLPPAPEVVAALHESALSPRSHGYQSYTGTNELRAAWAAWYAQYYGADLDPTKEILPLIGSKEGIMHIAMTFLEPGSIALVPNPGYPTYRAASMLAGAKVRYYNLKASNHWLPDFDALEKTNLSKVKVLWANYPHMPTGAPASAEIFERLVAFGKKHNILIVNDNPYSFILNEKPCSILAVPGAKEVAVELNSLSKSLNMAGWRIGIVAGHAQYIADILRFKSNMDSGQFLPMQQAAIKALQLSPDWYADLNKTYKARQEKALAILSKLGCQFEKHQQGLFVWAKIPKNYKSGYELSDKILYESNVFITPGGIFGSAGEQYIRISLCQEVAVFEKAIAQIENNSSFII